MKRAVLVTSLVVAATGSASAGTYLGVGIGTGPAITGDEGTERLEADGRSGKLLIGNRFSKLAIEGSITKFSVTRTDARGTPREFGDVYQAAAALKLNFPLGNNFEVFGRAGLHKTWLEASVDTDDTEGTGILLGGGFEYRLNLGVGGGSIFVDYQVSQADLEGERFKFDPTTRVWMLGLTVGI